jgi:redox-sensitive bicupin YhaK (pirin superfamily)
MKLKTVQQVTTAMPVKMGDNDIYQPFPSHALRQVDPFILLHHWGPYTFKPKNDAFAVDAHPHRGFEPVTFIFHGEVHHRDTMGNDSIIKEGGVQWMTAGKGVMHSEMGTKEFREKGGIFEIIQVWMNLPKSLKMTTPSYQGVQKDAIPTLTQYNGKVKINVVSGAVGDAKGPIKSVTDIDSYTIYMEEGGKASIEIDEKKNVMLYLLDGSIIVNGKSVDTGRNAVTFNAEGTGLSIEATSKSKILLLAGEPLREPVAQYGPFVMNTPEELQTAFEDFQKGKMGILQD